MKTVSRRGIWLSLAILAIGMSSVLSADNNQETRLKTRLTGAAIQGTTPEGSAEFRLESGKMRTRLQVEAEHVNLAAGTLLDVSIQHGTATTAAGQIKLNAFGSGELELDSHDGATVPVVQTGDMVIVSNAGTPILSGVF